MTAQDVRTIENHIATGQAVMKDRLSIGTMTDQDVRTIENLTATDQAVMIDRLSIGIMTAQDVRTIGHHLDVTKMGENHTTTGREMTAQT